MQLVTFEFLENHMSRFSFSAFTCYFLLPLLAQCSYVQLVQVLGWVAPAYHNKEGGTLHPGACKHSLLYEGRSDGRFGVRLGTWNIGSIRGGKVCEGLRKRMIDVCCLLEVR